MVESGGTLEIGLDRMYLDDSAARLHFRLSPGDHILLTISDSGVGMQPEDRERIFAPYFTTKGTGKGTGLGLAVVHGIVTSLGGSISLTSEIGLGTVFTLLLPCSGDRSTESLQIENSQLMGGHERILVVDDEITLLETVGALLESLGYRVVTAQNAGEALEMSIGDPDGFDPVITDLNMPQMTGIELARRLAKRRPDLPVILRTGFKETITGDQLRSADIRCCLSKPLSLEGLAENIRNALD